MRDTVTKLDTKSMAWEDVYNEAAGANLYRKTLAEDPETGVTVRITKYPAGFINPRHDHPCAHGMYVLKGTLRTSEGDFAPGAFLWFPEGEVMWHGATADEDVEIVFITNKKFEINYDV